MNPIEEICHGITECIPEILRPFNTASDVEPWTRFSADNRVAFLGELIAIASDLALSAPKDHVRFRRMLLAAGRHGAARREQGLPDTLIFSEFGIVRQAISSWVQLHYDPTSESVIEALIRLDLVFSLATKSALRGYHRTEFERLGKWPQVMEDLASEWNPPLPIG